MKKLSNLKGVKTLNKNEQKTINGSGNWGRPTNPWGTPCDSSCPTPCFGSWCSG